MNANLLIDALVRQTTVLIAQLATAAGARAALAHTANQVFMDLVRELKEQGLGNKVLADMFGLSLRTYHNRVARLSESSTERGRSLWEAMLAYIQERGPLARGEVLRRFARDDEATVRSVLKDLVDSGMVFRAGRGDFTTYQAAAVPAGSAEAPGVVQRTIPFVWLVVYRKGAVTRSELAEHVLATAIAGKLRLGRTQAVRGEWMGGSTYSFDLWDGHPLHDEVVTLLQSTRERAADLRPRVEDYNAAHPREYARKVTFYAGQSVVDAEQGLEGDES